MNYVFFVNQKNTFEVQLALFKKGYKWNTGDQNCKYSQKTALLVNFTTKTFKAYTRMTVMMHNFTELKVESLLKFSEFFTIHGQKLNIVEIFTKEVPDYAGVPKQETRVPVATKRYHYMPKNSTTMYVVSVQAEVKQQAWITCSSLLPNGKFSDIVSIDDLDELDSQDMQEAEVARIIKNVQHIETAAKHIVSFMVKQLVPEKAPMAPTMLKLIEKQTVQEIEPVPQSDDARYIGYTQQKVLKTFLAKYKKSVISRKDISILLNVNVKIAAKVLELLEKQGKVKIKNPGASHRWYVIK